MLKHHKRRVVTYLLAGLWTLGFRWLRCHARGHEVMRQGDLAGEGTRTKPKERFESAETKVSFMPTYSPSLQHGGFVHTGSWAGSWPCIHYGERTNKRPQFKAALEPALYWNKWNTSIPEGILLSQSRHFHSSVQPPGRGHEILCCPLVLPC